MTPLNTIIEEEKPEDIEKWVRTLAGSSNPRDTDLLVAKINVLRTTAMQRAYEAGCETSKWDMDNEYARGYNDGAYETRKLNSCAQPHRKKPTKGV